MWENCTYSHILNSPGVGNSEMHRSFHNFLGRQQTLLPMVISEATDWLNCYYSLSVWIDLSLRVITQSAEYKCRRSKNNFQFQGNVYLNKPTPRPFNKLTEYQQKKIKHIGCHHTIMTLLDAFAFECNVWNDSKTFESLLRLFKPQVNE